MDPNLLTEKFEKGLMTTGVLLGNAKLVDESSRQSSPFIDPSYLPFYYYLGCQVAPERVSQIGTIGGLPALCFLQGCKTVKEWNAAQEKVEHLIPENIIISNIMMKIGGGHGSLTAGSKLHILKSMVRPCDLALLTDWYDEADTEDYLNLLWENLSDEGLLVVDYINQDATKAAFEKFYRVKNRQPMLFNTRYGVGILQK